MGREKKVPQGKAQPMPKVEKVRQDVVGKKRGSGVQLKTVFHLPALCLLE